MNTTSSPGSRRREQDQEHLSFVISNLSFVIGDRKQGELPNYETIQTRSLHSTLSAMTNDKFEMTNDKWSFVTVPGA